MHEHASINRAYRAVFNEALGTVVAVPETARARGTRSTRACADSAFALRRLALAVAFALAGSPAWALDPATLPQGGQVAAGRASIASQGATMTVDQASTRAIVNWQSFDIGSGAAVRFVQPSAAAVTLNRVQSGPASQIFGRMDATGQVYVVNPAGILFGRTAQVNVGGLTASTLQIADEDFLAGRDRFTFAGRAGSVVNEGAIRVAPGGRIVLLGARVENRGALVAPGGDVALASGRQVTLAIGAKGHLQVAVDEAQVAALAANGGLVAADGGQVILTAKGADALASSVVSNTGTLQARTVAGQAGRILLLADMAHGTVQAGGTLDASAPQGGDGGFVETSAARVQVAPDLKVTTAAAQGRTGKWLIDPQDYTIAAAGGDITGTQLSSLLGTTDIEIQSSAGGSAGNGDIHVNDAVSWNANTLTLTAARDINVNAVMTASGTSALVMNTGTANGGDAGTGGGAVNVGLNDSGFIGRVDFPGRSGTGFLTINGNGYFVLDALGLGFDSTTGTDLQGINGNLAGHYALGGDLDASVTATDPWWLGPPESRRGGLRPIGRGLAPFTGSFNGLGHVITDLYTARTADTVQAGFTYSTVYGGLFGYTASSASVSNLGLAGGSTGIVDGCTNAPCYAGGLVGVNYGSVSNSWSTRTVTSGDSSGGLVGWNLGSIRNSFAVSDVNNALGASSVGGLAGTNSGSIADSFAGGTALSDGNTGGLVGTNDGVIVRSHATTSVTSGVDGGILGGLVGYNYGSITDSTAAATVTTQPGVWLSLGGLVGTNAGTIASSHAASTVDGAGGSGAFGGLVGNNGGTITDSDATGSVSAGAGSSSPVGGLVGSSSGTIVNSHYDVDGLLINGGHHVTYGALYGTQYQDWLGHGRTLAIGDYGASLPYNGATGYHEISSVQGLKDLLGFSQLPGLRFRLTSDLDLSVAPGLSIPVFAATEFDGAGHVLSNLAIAPPSFQVGMFGALASGSTLRNVTLENASVSGLGDTGALVGSSGGTVVNSHASGTVTGSTLALSLGGLVGSTTSGASIQDSDASVAVSGGASVYGLGGLVGSNSGSITGSHATGTVTSGAGSGDMGGLVGSNYGAVANSYATGAVTAEGGSGLGGLVGTNLGTIGNSYATGTVSGSSSAVGGLAGYNGVGGIADSYATGDVKGVDSVGGLVGLNDAAISNTYASGKVEGSSALGGLVGGASSFGSIANSYWNIDTAGPSVAPDGMERTTAQMQSQATFAGWDVASTAGTTSVWRIYEGRTAPLLRNFLTPLSVTTAYDGSGTPLAGAGAYAVPAGTDTGKILGAVGDTLTLSSTGAAGNYLASVDFSGLYSNQSGYDILAAPRTIATPGSAAGDVRLGNPITWTSGTVNITAAGNVDLNGQALTSQDGTLNLNAGTTIQNAGSVAVNLFDLQGGTWNQVAATLPSLSATDFRISGGTFLRALGGDGSIATPYQLADIYGVQGVASAGMGDKASVLVGDIDATGTATWNATAGFAPIALGASGAFDGQGHTISGLVIKRPDADDVGLFSDNQGTVADFGLVGGQVTGRDHVGAIAASSSGVIRNVYSTAAVGGAYRVGGLVGSNAGQVVDSAAMGSVNGSDATTGGLVAFNQGTITGSRATGTVTGTDYVGGLVGAATAGSITDSHATGTVTGNGQVGGLVGSNNAAIARSHATGAVTALSLSSAGGLVGENLGAIEESYATGTVVAEQYAAGGLVGWDLGGSITRSYATGAVEAKLDAAGGLVGNFGGTISNSYATGEVHGEGSVGGLVGLAGAGGSVTNSYASGAVVGSHDVGGLVGFRNPAAVVAGSYWDVTTTGQATSAGGSGVNTATMRQLATFAGWDISADGAATANVWHIYEGYTAPLLRSFLTPLTVTANDATKTYDGQAYDGAAGVRYSVAPDMTRLLGTPIYTSGIDAGTHAITLDGLYSNQQGYRLAFTEGTLTVDRKALTVTGMTAANKVYDGTVTAQLSGGTLSGLVAGETLGFSGQSGVFVDGKNVGTGKAVAVSGTTLADGTGRASNYTISDPTGLTADITPRTLTVTATAQGKTYDGTRDTTANLGDDHLAGDAVAVSHGLAQFSDKNAGTGKTVTVSGIAIAGGADGGNYVLASTTATTTADITPRPLNVTASVQTKTYDATRNASIGFNDDRIGGDALTLAGGGLFDDKNAGTGKTVAISGFSVGGSDAGNYTVVATPTTATGTILRRDITADIIAAPKVYDGTTDGAALVRGDTRLAGDNLTVSYGAATFADRNAGAGKEVTISGVAISGADAGNYNLLSPTINSQATIDPRLLTVNVDAANKVYDGTTQATVTLSDNRVAGDLLAVGSDPAFFQDRHAAPGKTVYVSGLGITGADAANYVLASGGATGTADITPRPLSVTALGLSKVYDRTDLATVTFGSDVLPIDSIGIAGTARFDNWNAGTGKTVNVTGIAVSGVNAGNYTLANPTTTATADITPRPLFVEALGDTRTYDGTTAATVHFQDDRLPGDEFAVSSAPVAFADRNAGTGKALSVTGIAIAGMDAGNYAVSNTTAATTADILRRSLLVFATGIDKVYDGTTAASVTFTDTRVAADQLLVTGDARFADKNVGAGKPVSVTGITVGGADAGNYNLASVPVNTVAAITPRALTIGATGVDKVYDRTTSATVNFTDDRVAGDSLSITGSANFGDRNVGAGKAVSVAGIALSGADAANYSFDTNTATTAAITPRPLLVTASGQDKVYDGTTAATVAAYGDDRVAGDVLAFSGTASFDDKNVGADKAVTVTGIAVTGADAGNYTFNTVAAASASITPRSLTVTATGQSRVYDGSTAATVIFGDDRVAGDVLAFSGTARFDDKNVGTGKAIGITGIGVTGADAGNYTFNATASTTADITRRALNVGATGIDKVYDGGTSAAVGFTDDRVTGDAVAVSGTANFSDKNVGAGKAVSIAGIAVTGADAGNYALVNTTAASTAAITPRVLTATPTAASKVYDGTTAAIVTFSDDRLAGDVLAVSGSGNFADRNAGTGKTVGVTARLTGADAGNYVLSANATATASITRAPLLVAVDDLLRLADGLAFFGGGGVHLIGLAAGDDASVLTGTPAWGGTAQGATLPGRYTLSVANYSAVNYDLRYAQGQLTLVPQQDLREGGEVTRQAQQDVQAPPVPVQPATVAARRGVPLTIAPDFLRVD